MPPSNLDDALRDLEKQVFDFSMAVENESDNDDITLPTNNTTSLTTNNSSLLDSSETTSSTSSLSSTSIPMQRHASMNRQPTSDTYIGTGDEDDDDNVCVAELRHRAQQQQQQQQQYHAHTTRSNTVKGTRSRNVPTAASAVSGLKRSVSSGGSGKQFKISEPVPPIPANLLAAKDQPPPRNDDDHDLTAAVQTAFAVLEAGGDTTTTTSTTATATENKSTEANIQQNISKAAGGGVNTPMKTLTIRIYINDGTKHKTVQLTNMLTSAMVVQYFRKKGLLLDSSEDWTLFEVDYSHDVERPLRDWEIVMDTTSAWEPDTKNYLVVKKYKYRDSLMADSVLQKRYPPNYGWLSIEYKKGRWQRRFFYIMDNAIHHAKDNKGTGSTPLCHLSAFDVYTMLHHVRGSPTEFVFAIRAQDKPHIFERPEDFMHLLAADDYDALRQWVLSIRCAKNMFHYQLFPHRVINPLGPIDAPASTTPAVPMDGSLRENRGTSSNGGKETALASRSNTLRRHKSTKELSRSIPSFNGNEETIKSNGGLSRHGSRRGPVGREGGTLLGNSENEPIENSPRHSPIPPSPQPTSVSADDSQPQTLIQIDDKVKFSKGSLLDKSVHGGVGNAMHGGGETTRLSRSRSTREPHHNHSSSGGGSSASGGNEAPSSSTGGGETRRQMSVRRKPTTSRAGRRPEIPVMPSAPAPGSGPLLQQEEDPEQAHTRRLMERQIKPLVNFNEPSSGFSPNRRY